MKKILLIFFAISMASCVTKTQNSNGFVNGADFKVQMGSQESVELFKALDSAWASLDYTKLKGFISDDAVMNFEDGTVAIGSEAFITKIQSEVEEKIEQGETYEWTTDYAFALSLEGATESDPLYGDWVNAQFTSKQNNPDSEIAGEIFYEFYQVRNAKVVSWTQFKKTVLKK